MTDMYVSNGSLLCQTHARRQAGHRPSGQHLASVYELLELGNTCEDCTLYGPPVVRAIRVGGEAHCVEGADGKLREEIVASEQCDACGSTREAGSQAPFFLDESRPMPEYRCERCGARYRIIHSLDTETVF